MKRRIELQRRLRSLETLHVAVSAMKSISARHFRQTRRAIEPSRIYREGIEQIAAWTGASLPAGTGQRGLLVIGGELGLCGGYNTAVVSEGLARRRELGDGPTICVGRRAATLLSRRGVDLSATYATPTSVDGITRALLPLAEKVLDLYVSEGLSGVEIVSSVFTGIGSHTPTSQQLLPIESPVAPDAPRVRYVNRELMATAAARELLYVTLYDLLLDAVTCEHSARLVATQAAERWLDERRELLGRQLASTRREASTQEVLEIASGARVRRRVVPAGRGS